MFEVICYSSLGISVIYLIWSIIKSSHDYTKEYPNGSILDYSLYMLDLSKKELLETTEIIAFDERTLYGGSLFAIKSQDKYCVKYHEKLVDGRKTVKTWYLNEAKSLLFEENTDVPRVCKYSLKLEGYEGERIFYELIIPKGTVSTF